MISNLTANLTVATPAPAEVAKTLGLLSFLSFQLSFNQLTPLGRIALFRAAGAILARASDDGVVTSEAIALELFARYRHAGGDWRAVLESITSEVAEWALPTTF
jgi:hypothetical protein